ncbi:MAG: response regulator transcription factor [Bacteroidota bacterium]
MHKITEIGIIEDDPQIRQLMQMLLDATPGFQCTRTFGSVEEGVPAFLKQPVPFLLMDIDLPGQSGIEGIQWLKKEHYPGHMIMLTIHEDQEAVFDSLCAGAIGYLVKGLPPVQLIAALEEAVQGGAPMSPEIARRVVTHFHRDPATTLTTREQEILRLLSHGENYRSIAEQLFISRNTVKTHIKNIYEKLQVNTRAEAIGKAIKNRLV